MSPVKNHMVKRVCIWLLSGVLVLGVAAFVARLAPNDPPPPAPKPPIPELIAVSPDGAKLWRIKDGSQTVYFSTSGASWTAQAERFKPKHHVLHTPPTKE